MTTTGIVFLAWQDAKAPLARRIADARASYLRRFGTPATLLALPLADAGVEVDGVEIIGKATVPAGAVWAGRREA